MKITDLFNLTDPQIEALTRLRKEYAESDAEGKKRILRHAEEILGLRIDNLRELRKRKGLSQKELAERAGVDQSYISLLERGLSRPSDEVLKKILGALK